MSPLPQGRHKSTLTSSSSTSSVSNPRFRRNSKSTSALPPVKPFTKKGAAQIAKVSNKVKASPAPLLPPPKLANPPTKGPAINPLSNSALWKRAAYAWAEDRPAEDPPKKSQVLLTYSHYRHLFEVRLLHERERCDDVPRFNGSQTPPLSSNYPSFHTLTSVLSLSSKSLEKRYGTESSAGPTSTVSGTSPSSSAGTFTGQWKEWVAWKGGALWNARTLQLPWLDDKTEKQRRRRKRRREEGPTSREERRWGVCNLVVHLVPEPSGGNQRPLHPPKNPDSQRVVYGRRKKRRMKTARQLSRMGSVVVRSNNTATQLVEVAREERGKRRTFSWDSRTRG